MMKLITLLFGCILLVGPSAIALGNDADEIRAAVRAWEEAFDDKPNRANLYKLYAKDAVLWGTSRREPAQGHEAIRRYFARSSTKGRALTLKYEKPMLIRVDGDTAVNSGRYVASFKNKAGETIQRALRYTITYRRIDGEWQIVAHHSSRMPKKR